MGPGYTDPKWFGYGIGIALRKSDTDLRDKLNAAIDAIRADGTYDKIAAKVLRLRRLRQLSSGARWCGSRASRHP